MGLLIAQDMAAFTFFAMMTLPPGTSAARRRRVAQIFAERIYRLVAGEVIFAVWRWRFRHG
jgi:hypothetical protein